MADPKEQPRTLFVFGAPSTLRFRPGPDGKPIEILPDPIVLKAPDKSLAVPPGLRPLLYSELKTPIHDYFCKKILKREKQFLKERERYSLYHQKFIHNAERVNQLVEFMESIKRKQNSLETTVESVKEAQAELETEISLLEASLDFSATTKAEKELSFAPNPFLQAEKVGQEFQAIWNYLKELIDEINKKPDAEKTKTHPIFQMAQILNSHTETLTWLEETLAEITTGCSKVAQVNEELKSSVKMKNSNAETESL